MVAVRTLKLRVIRPVTDAFVILADRLLYGTLEPSRVLRLPIA